MKLLLIFSLTLSLNISCSNIKPVKPQRNIQQETTKEASVLHQKSENKTVEKYGFQFQIPEHWTTKTNDFKTKNLKGEVKTIETEYFDNQTKSRIKIINHPGDSGLLLYNYYSKDTSEKMKKIKIGQLDALNTDEHLTRDGKGNLLSLPIIRHKIYIVSTDKKGVLEIVYDLLENNTKAGQVYKDFINSIKSDN